MPDTTIRFNISSNQDLFLVENIGQINNSITIDPMNWVINKTGTIQNDPNLLGIDETEISGIVLYPNPVEDLLHIKGDKTQYDYLIYDMRGQLVMKGSADASINVHSLSGGSYIVELNGLRKLISKR